MERRLAAILAADMVGYSRMMEADEEGTLAALKRMRAERIDPPIAENHGRIVKATGDGVLVEFPSVVDALRCAVEIQESVAEEAAGVPIDRRMRLRIGVNLGDVIIDQGDIFGEGVNVAARLEGLAQPGAIMVSQSVRELARGKVAVEFEDLGDVTVKNIERPIHVFGVVLKERATERTPIRHEKSIAHPTSQRAILWGVVALSILFGLVGIYVLVLDRGDVLRPEEAIAGAGPALAVLPFRVVGDESDLWREGMVDLLSTNLDGAAGIRTIAPRTVISRWHRRIPAGREPTDAEALAVAREIGARYALVGGMVALGGEVRLTAQVYDLERGRLGDEIQVRGVPDSVPALVDRLSIEVLRAALAREADLPAVDLRRVTTTSLPALKAYLAGVRNYRRSQWRAAIADLTRAVEADTTFALALYRLSESYGWTGSPERFVLAERAARFADRLPERDAMLFRANVVIERNPREGLRLIEELTRRHPDDPDAWYALGEAYYHDGIALLHTMDEVRAAFQRAIDLDPGYGPAYVHLISEDAFARGDSAGVRSLLARYRRIDPTSPEVRALEYAFALAWGDDSARDRARAAIAVAGYEELYRTAFALRWWPDFWEPALEVAREMSEERHRIERRRSGHRIQALIFLQRGRIREAREALFTSPGGDPLDVQNSRFLLTWHMENLVDDATARRAAESLAESPDPLDHFLIGALAADERRWQDAEREATAILGRGEAQDSLGEATRQAMSRSLRAYVALRRGEARRGADELIRALPDLPGTCPGPMCNVHGSLRLDLGRTLLALGDAREAAPWLESISTLSYATPVELYLGETYEALGDRRAARERYARCVRWWADADPAQRALFDEARRALERVS